MLLEAFERIDPPLLTGTEYLFVVTVLGRKRGRRPDIAGPAEDLANRLSTIRRNDVHPVFVETLADRLESNDAFPEFDRSLKVHKLLERRKREVLIRCLYFDFRDLLDGRDHIDHPTLGRVDVPQDVRTRSDQALLMTQSVLRGRLGYTPPSLRRLMNIVSGR